MTFCLGSFRATTEKFFSHFQQRRKEVFLGKDRGYRTEAMHGLKNFSKTT
jgi:hypothetical protein